MSHEEEHATKRRGPKPNNVGRLSGAYQRAHAKAEKARRAYAKVQRLAEELAAAEQAEQEAYDALQEALAELPGPGAPVDDEEE